jgi:plasmid stability protein
VEPPVPVNLSVKNVPDELAEKLRQRAERNHRSLQRELMAILEQATQGRSFSLEADEPEPDTPRISVEELFERTQKLFPKGSPSSVDFIRQSRDGRYGEDWVRTGKHKEPE